MSRALQEKAADLLVRLQWSSDASGQGSECPICHGFEPHGRGPLEGHRGDCDLVRTVDAIDEEKRAARAGALEPSPIERLRQRIDRAACALENIERRNRIESSSDYATAHAREIAEVSARAYEHAAEIVRALLNLVDEDA